ncbi:hypothetical protein LP419_40205 [Massilia sp. H-1]|nr:hypothetical protein LP419_40205 [Massilia sp. H-1]
MSDDHDEQHADPRAQFLSSLNLFTRQHRAGHWSGPFSQFMEQLLPQAPQQLARTSHQYIWDMIRATCVTGEQDHLRCRLSEEDLFGIDEALERVIDYFKAAAAGSEVGRRLLLLLGPPSGGKSTLVILLKRAGRIQLYRRRRPVRHCLGCPVHESPLHLVPHTMRASCRNTYGIDITGDICPHCRRASKTSSPATSCTCRWNASSCPNRGRSGIGTYAPHDPTTADLADLVGSVDLSKVAQFGDEGDPRAWSWSGAVYAASRGVLEMIEILKVKREFL